MPFNRPSLAAIIERIGADIASRLPGADARLRRSNLAVLARAEAGVAHGLYGYADQIARQVIIDTADTEYLERWGAVWRIPRKSAIAATGMVTFTGTTGTAIPAGVVLQRADGVEYETSASGVIAGGTATLPVVARVSGELGNAGVGTTLALAAQILGVSSVAVVSDGGLFGGTDIESDTDLRARILTRIQRPPHGGADFDYEDWALEVPGVTRAWIYPSWMGGGTVGVFFVRDGSANIIPSAGDVAIVQAYIESQRPVTAEVYVLAPTPLMTNFTIHVTPDTPAVRAAVEAELVDVFRRESKPGATLPISHLREAISLADGEQDHVLSVPAGDVVAGPGQMPMLGAITWV